MFPSSLFMLEMKLNAWEKSEESWSAFPPCCCAAAMASFGLTRISDPVLMQAQKRGGRMDDILWGPPLTKSPAPPDP